MAGERWEQKRGQSGVLFQRPRRARRAGLAQLVSVLIGLLAGLFVPKIGIHPVIGSERVVGMLFTIGFGVIGLVSIIYSLLILVVQWAASNFTPRLVLFRDDPVVWRTFAFALGTFIFCITAALAIGTRRDVSIAVPVLAMLLALGAMGLMRTLQLRAFSSIQLAPSLNAISARTRSVIVGLYTRPRPEHPRVDGGAAEPEPAFGPGSEIAWPGSTLVLQQIDVPALLEAARLQDCLVIMAQPPGTVLVHGQPIASVHGGELDPQVLLDTLLPGLERSFDQDPELGIRLLADIALRALSTAVNDPATAVQAIDHLEDLLLTLADRDLDIGRVRDAEGALRVLIPVPDWRHYVRLATDDLTATTQLSPMVLLRLREHFRRLISAGPSADQPFLQARLTSIDDRIRERHPLVWQSQW